MKIELAEVGESRCKEVAVKCRSAYAMVAGVAAMMMTTAAIAGTPPPASKKNPDPNEVVCEKQQLGGSRLVTRRVCRTRAQWADMKLQDRQELERVQVQRGMKGD